MKSTSEPRSTGIGLLVSILACWICSGDFSFAAASPFVKIKNGTLEGSIMKSRNGRDFVSFRGIPYAQPPIDELRFEPPKPTDSWNGVRSAKKDSNICPQRDIFTSPKNVGGDEDCLYLNVYTPNLPNGDVRTRTNYPVMIWIHGGSWTSGAGHSMLYGPKFLLDHDIVLVTPNYRIGPLGFLSTEDLVVPGNHGLKDQAQALRWVHENIAAFGGDPTRVTLFGESAGAVSAHYHMISPLSRGLFHRVISQSGNVHCPWALSRPGIARSYANRLGELLGCPTDKSTYLIECLRKKKPADFVMSDTTFQKFDSCPQMPFKVVIEPDHPGAFLNEEPTESLKSGNMVDVPWMTGTNSHEGALKTVRIYADKEKEYDKQLDANFMDLAPMTLLYEDTCPEEFRNNVSERIREFYLGDNKIDWSRRKEVSDMYTDAWFYIAADNAVRDHLEAASSPVYYYHFTFKGGLSMSALLGDAKNDYGVVHGDDLQFFFPMDQLLFKGTKPSREDYRMVDLMTKLWVNFAESGNPTPEKNSDIPVRWKPVRTSKLEYLNIGGPKNLSMAENLHAERVRFWRSIPHRGEVQFKSDERRNRDEL